MASLHYLFPERFLVMLRYKLLNLQPSRTIKLFFCGPKGGLRTNLFVSAQNEKYISAF